MVDYGHSHNGLLHASDEPQSLMRRGLCDLLHASRKRMESLSAPASEYIQPEHVDGREPDVELGCSSRQVVTSGSPRDCKTSSRSVCEVNRGQKFRQLGGLPVDFRSSRIAEKSSPSSSSGFRRLKRLRSEVSSEELGPMTAQKAAGELKRLRKPLRSAENLVQGSPSCSREAFQDERLFVSPDGTVHSPCVQKRSVRRLKEEVEEETDTDEGEDSEEEEFSLDSRCDETDASSSTDDIPYDLLSSWSFHMAGQIQRIRGRDGHLIHVTNRKVMTAATCQTTRVTRPSAPCAESRRSARGIRNAERPGRPCVFSCIPDILCFRILHHIRQSDLFRTGSVCRLLQDATLEPKLYHTLDASLVGRRYTRRGRLTHLTAEGLFPALEKFLKQPRFAEATMLSLTGLNLGDEVPWENSILELASQTCPKLGHLQLGTCLPGELWSDLGRHMPDKFQKSLRRWWKTRPLIIEAYGRRYDIA
jgi:hypothetical protein